jgi:hypothetical protein
MSQILKFPDIVSRRTPKDGTFEEAVGGTEAKDAEPSHNDGRSMERIYPAANARGATGVHGRRVEAHKSLLPADWRVE